MPNDLTRASGLWVKDGKRSKFMSGATSDAIPAGAKLFLFRNDRKEAERDPDYVLHYVVEGEQVPMQRAEPQRQPTAVVRDEISEFRDEDPF